ncbi:hypothetical protein JM83_3131 [Gillisia sp. Hel_I_86]|uniref:hypothetical protein n=1 Tax=Gillisia sp. Hel_I_86 TaxID=1249981 RepID=UPI00119A18D8|nr:hypothetical protein [Gillisia sp. Hel_I_86]TVZ28044.1 hypothetical protein JM83_3131 [Gillisia sp. Hel_I_86]
MKTLILTFTLLVNSVLLHAQDYAVVLTSNPRTAHKAANYSELTHFTSDVILNEEFKYRDFLKNSKKSKADFNFDGKTFTKMELTKTLRKAAITARDYKEFQKLLENNHPEFLSVLSIKEMHLLYEKFRKGSLNSYFQDLAENW